jgi:hypothetical protein
MNCCICGVRHKKLGEMHAVKSGKRLLIVCVNVDACNARVKAAAAQLQQLWPEDLTVSEARVLNTFRAAAKAASN